MDPATIKETLKGENSQDVMVMSEDDPAAGPTGGGGGGVKKKKRNGQSVKTLAQNARIRDAYAVPTARDRWGTLPTNVQQTSKEERQDLACDRLSDLKEKRKARSLEAQKSMRKAMMQKTGSVPGSPNNNPHLPNSPHLPVAMHTDQNFMYPSETLRQAGMAESDNIRLLQPFHQNYG